MALELDAANKIVEVLIDELGIDASVYESYSGRAMYGAETTAIVIQPGQLMMLGVAAGLLIERGDTDIDPYDLPSRTDSLGMDTVVY